MPSLSLSLFLSLTHLLSQDKQGIPWWLGLSYKGIFQYDYQDKVKPRKVSPSKTFLSSVDLIQFDFHVFTPLHLCHPVMVLSPWW